MCCLLFVSERSIWIYVSSFLLILGALHFDNSDCVLTVFLFPSFFFVMVSVCCFSSLLFSVAILASLSVMEYTSPIFGTPSGILSFIFCVSFSCFFVFLHIYVCVCWFRFLYFFVFFIVLFSFFVSFCSAFFFMIVQIVVYVFLFFT